jgi:predicted nucleic acid-binding protein
MIPSSDIIWVLPLVREFYDEILDMMRKHCGRLKVNDAFIALLMKRNQLRYIASFDADFDELPALRRIATAADASSLPSAT